MANYVRKNFLLIIILFAAFVLRFYRFPDRIVLNQDQAWAGAIAIEAMDRGDLPLIGFPSSAGPFNFGPWFFWLVILFSKMFYFYRYGAWIGFCVLSLLTSVGFYFLGRKLLDHKFGIILFLISSLNPVFVEQTANMLNTILVPYLVLFSFLMLSNSAGNINKSTIVLALSGFLLGMAVGAHFQALGLIALPGFTILFEKTSYREKIRKAATAGGGFVLSFLPLIIFDLKNSHSWSRSVISYFLGGGQDKFHVPVRWLTDITEFWPQNIGMMIVGQEIAGYHLVAFVGFILVLSLYKKAIDRTTLAVFATLFVQVILLRYYEGPRSPEYLFFLLPLIIYIVGWSLYKLSGQKYRIGLLVTFVIVLLSLFKSVSIVKHTSQAKVIENIKSEIDKSVTGNVTVYTTPTTKNMLSVPLMYLYLKEGRVGEDGRIGTCIDKASSSCPADHRIFHSNGYNVYDFKYLEKAEIAKLGFERIDPDTAYEWIYINYKN